MDVVRQAATESTVTVTDADKEKGKTTDQNSFFFGFDYSHCEDVTVTGDGLAILKLYYNREIWSIKLHTTPMRDNTTKSEYEALKGNDTDVWLTFSGRYGSLLPDNYPAWEELNEKFGDEVPEGWTDPNHPEPPLSLSICCDPPRRNGIQPAEKYQRYSP